VRFLACSSLLGLISFAAEASAERLAVLPLESPGHQAPALEAERLSADLIAQGQRVVTSADALARISAGNEGTGPDWAAETIRAIDGARGALTRLDRAEALRIARNIASEVVRRGGGAGGSEVLVEWCLLERQLALTASDARSAAEWLDRAVAYGPTVELDALRHPDEERDLLARRRPALQGEVAATLSIVTTPGAAEIWVDGVRRCESPCTVSLVPGHHLARATSPAHAPAIIEVELGPGASTSRQVGLSAAYSGASPRAISSMLADPSRRAEGASALEPMARFLDVDHVVALVPEGNGIRVILSPPPIGRPRFSPAVATTELTPTVVEQLRPMAPPDEKTSIFKKPLTWIVGAGVVAGIVAGVLVYGASSHPASSGSITVQ